MMVKNKKQAHGKIPKKQKKGCLFFTVTLRNRKSNLFNRKMQVDFLCESYHFACHADIVGAMNILRAGRAQLVYEVNGAVRPSAA